MADERSQELIGAILSGSLEESDAQELERLLAADPGLATEFRRQAALDTFLRVNAGKFPRRDDLYARVARELEAEPRPLLRWLQAPRLLSFRNVAFAAAACLTLAIGLRLLTLQPPGSPSHGLPVLAVVASHQGRVQATGVRGKRFLLRRGNRILTKSDDSRATLELLQGAAALEVLEHSSIALSGEAAQLTVQLDRGRVKLTTHGSAASFCVATGLGEARTTDGEFELHLVAAPKDAPGGEQMVLQVTRGQVQLANRFGAIEVGAGESALTLAGEPPRLETNTPE